MYGKGKGIHNTQVLRERKVREVEETLYVLVIEKCIYKW